MSTAAKHFLFFYRFASAYLMSEVVFQDCSETICSPWHISLSSGGPSSLLTFIFTFFQVICSTSSENPLMERETCGDWRDISSFTCKFSRLKRRRLIIGQERVCLSVCWFIYISVSGCWLFSFGSFLVMHKRWGNHEKKKNVLAHIREVFLFVILLCPLIIQMSNFEDSLWDAHAVHCNSQTWIQTVRTPPAMSIVVQAECGYKG